jgi:phospholipid transport system substrate-binding protein
MLATSLPAAATDAEVFVRDLGDRTVALFADKVTAAERRKEQFRDLLLRGFDLERIGQFVVGKSWRDASADQRGRYLRSFERYVIETYYVRFAGYAGATFRVVSSVPLENADSMVRTEIIRAGAEAPLKVDYRVAGEGGKLRIIDVIVEGVSLLVTHRQEFNAVLNRQGLDGLINLLEERSSSLAKS